MRQRDKAIRFRIRTDRNGVRTGSDNTSGKLIDRQSGEIGGSLQFVGQCSSRAVERECGSGEPSPESSVHGLDQGESFAFGNNGSD